MATGTTFDFVMTRDDICNSAARKLGRLKGSSTLDTANLANFVQALNVILRQEDLKNTRQARDLWALTEDHLILVANQVRYSNSDGLSTNIRDISSAYYRNTSGEDNPVEIITKDQYESIIDKNDTGDVEAIYLEENRLLASRALHVWPAPSSIGTTSEVTGSDSLNYSCIMGHTSAALNKPITGADWRLYWKQTGSAGSAWATGASYTNGTIIRYAYKRPLFDFDSASDNPDMPSGWNKFLIFTLAAEMGPEYQIDLDTQRALDFKAKEARAELFNSRMPVTTDFHNKAKYF